jgi:hypothetical protein
MAATLKTWSVVIRWHDSYDDMGDFGEVVKARDPAHAERIVRARMCWAHWRDHREPGEDRRESLSLYDNGDGTFFGSVVECSEGAIWKAKELEVALRDMRAAYGRLHDFLSDAIEGGRLTAAHIPDDFDAIADQLEECATADAGAESVLKEIDGM